MQRAGFYVEGKYFAGRSAQAIAFAQFRANEYGRNVTVQEVSFDGKLKDIGFASPGEQQMQVA